MKYLIDTAEKYKKDNRFSEFVQRYSNQDTDACNETEKDEFIILHTIYDFISEAFAIYELDINKLIPDDCTDDFISDLVFNHNAETNEDAIIQKLRKIFIDTALEQCIQKYTA